MKNETIVDRVVERLKTQPLGDLITEEDLHDIVKTAIPKVFFEERTIETGSGYHTERKKAPPLIFDAMKELLQDSARQAVSDWIAKNTQVLADHWKQVLDQNILEYVQKMQDAKATAQVQLMLKPLLDDMNKQRQAMGLMPIYF